jgi:flagellar hook-associated protein 1 FlgK
MDYSGINYDYNDNLYLISNMKPEAATDPASPALLPGAAALMLNFDQAVAGTLADATGLFTWSGSPAVPGSGTVVDGIAGSISINAAMDSTIGGNPELLRDGGANGAAYKHNVTNAASFSDLLLGYADKLDQPIAFDATSGVAGTKSVSDYAAASIGWLGSMRQDAAQGSESKNALATRTSSALSNATGVNMDEEMSLLLELEHSYQASARLISTVDSMLAALLQAAG